MMPHERAEKIEQIFKTARDSKLITNLNVQVMFSMTEIIDNIHHQCDGFLSKEFIEMLLKGYPRLNYNEGKEGSKL